MNITSDYLRRLKADFFYNSRNYNSLMEEIIKNRNKIEKLITEDGFKDLSEEEKRCVKKIIEFKKDILIPIVKVKNTYTYKYVSAQVPISYKYDSYEKLPKKLKVKVDKHIEILVNLYNQLSDIEEIWGDLINKDTKLTELKKFFPEIYNKLIIYDENNKTI